MVEISLPLSISYQTKGVTPIADVVEALQATDAISRDAISLLPSLIDGLEIARCDVGIKRISQESPLREVLFLTLFVTFQDDLSREVPLLLEELFETSFPEKYETIATVVFMVVVFYGVSFARDAALKTIEDHSLRKMLNGLLQELSQDTGKSVDQIMDILKAKFEKPTAVKRLLRKSRSFFLPSKREENAPLVVDRTDIPTSVVRDVPMVSGIEEASDFDRYEAYSDVQLEIHAMDRDKSATGWAAGMSRTMLKSVSGDAADFMVMRLDPTGQPAHHFVGRGVFPMR
ncbi:hypothetical protein AAFO90_24305, partial [Phaeobacter sp. CAU 1743]|uniref:hypothetical protein n=1 Tax=Phaeobacter sp. CAU 1743 TaxID=3140367 RepID=UPI00325A8A61